MRWLGLHPFFTKREAREVLPPAPCKLTVHITRCLPSFSGVDKDDVPRTCMLCGVTVVPSRLLKALYARRGFITVGKKMWVAPRPLEDDPKALKYTVSVGMIMSERCARCGTVRVGKWVTAEGDEPLPERPPPPEHTQAECDEALVNYVHDL